MSLWFHNAAEFEDYINSSGPRVCENAALQTNPSHKLPKIWDQGLQLTEVL